MKGFSCTIFVVFIGFLSLRANEQAQTITSSNNNKLAQSKAVATQVKNKILTYVHNALPKTKKDIALTIISEGIADGILLVIGAKGLSQYQRNNPQDFIDTMEPLTGQKITEIAAHQTDAQVKEAVDEVLGTTGIKKPVCIHYAHGVPGPFCHAKNHLFLAPKITSSLAEEDIGNPHSVEEVKFLTAHELSHVQNKDLLKKSLVAIAAPALTYAAVKLYEKATSKLIDLLIVKMNLDKNSQGYKILTHIKTINSKVITNPAVRFIIALSIWLAYVRYTEKRADLFAAKHGYAPAGAQWAGRLEENLDTFSKMGDVFHPQPAERVKYLKKAAQKKADGAAGQ